MPPVKPSDKSGREGEWWKDDQTDRSANNVDPNNERDIDMAYVNETAFHESQQPIETPT